MLPWAEFWYNTTYQSAVETTPFKVLYGRDPLSLLKWKDQPSCVQAVDKLIQERNLILDELKRQLEKAQVRLRIKQTSTEGKSNLR